MFAKVKGARQPVQTNAPQRLHHVGGETGNRNLASGHI